MQRCSIDRSVQGPSPSAGTKGTSPSAIKRDYETVDQETACKLLGIANAEHAHILELFEARDAVGVRDYVRDVHWNTGNAQFTVW